MALTRDALRAEVAALTREALALATIPETDAGGDLAEPLNQALRVLGFAESDLATATVPDGDERKAIEAGVFFALDRATRALVTKMNVAAGDGVKANLREQWANVRVQRDDQANVLRRLGVFVTIADADGPVVAAIPYAGGTSQADRDLVAADADLVPPLFPRPVGW